MCACFLLRVHKVFEVYKVLEVLGRAGGGGGLATHFAWIRKSWRFLTVRMVHEASIANRKPRFRVHGFLGRLVWESYGWGVSSGNLRVGAVGVGSVGSVGCWACFCLARHSEPYDTLPSLDCHGFFEL